MDPLHKSTAHGVKTQKCSQYIAIETSSGRYSHSCYEEGKASVDKSGLRKEEDEILDLGLEKWMQFG